MKTLPVRLARLNRRTKTLLAVAGAVFIIAVVAGGLLALNPPLAVRLGRTLPGAAWQPPGANWGGKLRPVYDESLC